MLELLKLTSIITCACLFKLRPGVLSKTQSHMWGKLNLPMFLFNVGLLILIKIDSLIFLAKLCSSLPIIWKLLWLLGWPYDYCADTWVRVLQVFLVSFTKGPGGFPYILIITGQVTTLEPIYGPTFADHGVFVLGGYQ